MYVIHPVRGNWMGEKVIYHECYPPCERILAGRKNFLRSFIMHVIHLLRGNSVGEKGHLSCMLSILWKVIGWGKRLSIMHVIHLVRGNWTGEKGHLSCMLSTL